MAHRGPCGGIFEIVGQQIESDRVGLPTHIRALRVALFDHGRHEFVLCEHGQPCGIEHLPPGVPDDDDEVDPDRLRARISRRPGRPVSRGPE
jgi:hypothetical protein